MEEEKRLHLMMFKHSLLFSKKPYMNAYPFVICLNKTLSKNLMNYSLIGKEKKNS